MDISHIVRCSGKENLMNKKVKKIIFGKKICFLFQKCKYADIISEELDIYPDEMFEEIQADYIVTVDDNYAANEDDHYGRNPKEMYVSKDNFCINYSWGIVSWSKGKIHLSYNPKMYGKIASFVRHMLDIQFYTQPQWAGQRLYEDILINIAFWDPNYFVLHGSGISDNNGNVIIIGGTGGTGKTSTVLSMRGRKDRIFVCDDLCPITREGQVFVNYDMPKIYAYNVINNKEMEDMILKDEGFISRLQWKALKKGNPARVRRRVKPSKLYSLADPDLASRLHLKAYLILNRTCDVNDIKIDEIDGQLAAEMTVEIMRTEFAKFSAFLNYYKLNGLYKGEKTFPDAEECFTQWKNNMMLAFEKSSIKMISIPYDYNNEKLKERMNSIIDQIYSRKTD